MVYYGLRAEGYVNHLSHGCAGSRKVHGILRDDGKGLRKRIFLIVVQAVGRRTAYYGIRAESYVNLEGYVNLFSI